MKRFFLLCIVFGFVTTSFLFSQHNLQDTVQTSSSSRSAAAGFAEEEFRRGVQSYYRGAFNESILEFEKALSYLPGENLILDWLGKAYYRSGIEGAAIQQWQFAKESNYGGILLENRIEVVSSRRITEDESTGFSQRYTESGTFPYMNNKTLVYSQPVSSLCNADGSFWVVSYGTNELLKYNVNGVVIHRVRGPLNGLDRPMDIVRTKDGLLLVSESAGDRIAVLDENGIFQKYIGSKGRKEGQFIGPQYMALDSFENIYVTDFGNSRVVVFDADGNPLLTFGQKQKNFKGLKAPTGICVVEDRIFVADNVLGGIYEFDRAGNYIDTLAQDKTFSHPESLKLWGSYILVADSNRIISVDPATGATYENVRTGNAPSALTSAVPDINGNLVVTDFKNNEICIMAKTSELVGGFFVQIERVVADNFPNVVLEVRVENRRRQQVVGLNSDNFLVTEGKRPVSNFEFLGAANNNDIAEITFLIDRSSYMKNYEAELNSAVREIVSSMKEETFVQIVSAGQVPVVEFAGDKSKLKDFNVSSLRVPYTELSSLDLGIRLAANELINAEKKRGIIYITAGKVSQNAFTQYGLSDISAYLNNNAISFSNIMLSHESVDSEIQYITDNTFGKSYYVYRPEGLSSVVKDIISLPSGLYQLSYTSALPIEYGRKYLPVEVETYLLNRSGRDETGYFAPLQ